MNERFHGGLAVSRRQHHLLLLRDRAGSVTKNRFAKQTIVYTNVLRGRVETQCRLRRRRPILIIAVDVPGATRFGKLYFNRFAKYDFDGFESD
jgi:hypothetical protein